MKTENLDNLDTLILLMPFYILLLIGATYGVYRGVFVGFNVAIIYSVIICAIVVPISAVLAHFDPLKIGDTPGTCTYVYPDGHACTRDVHGVIKPEVEC